MNTGDQVVRDIFLLSLFLVAVAYFVGFVSDTNSVFSAVRSLILTVTGRDQNGNFAGYPKPPAGTNISTLNQPLGQVA